MKKYSDVLIGLVIILIVILIWLGLWKWVDLNVLIDPAILSDPSKQNIEMTNYAIRGQFGDKFGAVNALFSGLAFAGIIFTILLQRKDLAETRHAMSHERFDNTFFQLLNLHIDITSKLEARGNIGKEAFKPFNEYLKRSDMDFYVFCALEKLSRNNVRLIIDTKIVNRDLYPSLDDADIANINEAFSRGIGSFNNYLDDSIDMHSSKIIQAYRNACIQFIDYFSHYFRNLYHLLKFIDESDLITNSEKKSYSKFVRSQLSEIELMSIFYNSLAKIDLPSREDMELGYPKMARLIQKYDILQNMNPLSVIHPIHLKIFEQNNGKVGNAN